MPPHAERAGRLGQPELGGERERPLGGRDRLPVGAADDARRRQLRVGGDELGAGRLRLEQRERLGERLLPPRVAKLAEHAPRARSARARRRRSRPAGGRGRAPPRARLVPPGGGPVAARPAPSARAARRARDGRRGRARAPWPGSPRRARRRAGARARPPAPGSGSRSPPAPPPARAWPAAPDELERLQVVVGEHVGQVLGPLARLALEPGGGRAVAGGAGGARDLGVADVPDQQVPEAVLGLALHRAVGERRTSSLRASSCSACSTSRGSRSPISASAPAQNTLPTTAASWSRLLRSGESVSRRAAISACTESGTSSTASLELPAVGEQAHELLRIQRVAARPLEQRLLRLRGQHRPLEQRARSAARSPRRSAGRG